MSDKSVEWLLEENNPSVKFLTLTSLRNRSLEDPVVEETRKAIMEYGIVPEILNKQNKDGSWGTEDRFYKDKYTGTVWTLLILAEMAADPEDQRIKNACEFIFNHSQEPEHGGFSYTQSAKTGRGLVSGVVPCLTGNMVYTMIKLGHFEDDRVQKGIEWIAKYQRADDAVEQAPVGSVYERYEMCWGNHSCHMGVAKTLKALAAISPERRTNEINIKIDELVEYFLRHHIYKKSHNLETISRPGWLKLGFPLMYQTDILELLEICAE
jgi:hypothetical protein